MSTEENKALVLKALKALGDRDLPTLFGLIHEEGSWSVPFDPARFQFGGFKDKPAVMELLTGFLGAFDSFAFTVENATAEEDRVVVEARSEGVGPAGARYQNNYILIFFIKDGQLHTVREYFDPFKVYAYVEQLPAADG
ncbi:nuclear transport factor 2 family protein [Sphingomonas sp. ID0503]|uniref:nuclear transport factor 2 family protein n=1 Tax=Sphingomonas sp. ID0503 TaxID=3399691 RepID=UPI003AFA2FC0